MTIDVKINILGLHHHSHFQALFNNIKISKEALVISFDNMIWNWSSHSSWILFYFQVLSHHSCLETHRKPESWQKRKNLMYKSRTAWCVSSPLRESFPLHLLQTWDEVYKRKNPNFAVLERQMWTVLIGLSFTWCLHEVQLIFMYWQNVDLLCGTTGPFCAGGWQL